jgi:hypothetical protein
VNSMEWILRASAALIMVVVVAYAEHRAAQAGRSLTMVQRTIAYLLPILSIILFPLDFYAPVRWTEEQLAIEPVYNDILWAAFVVTLALPLLLIRRKGRHT